MHKILLAATIAVLALPFTGAHATSHCNSPVNFLSGTGLLLNPRTVGCDVIAEDFPETPIDESNTDWLTPGAASGVVRWLEGGLEPVDGVKNPDGTVTGSQVATSWSPNPIALDFTRGDTLGTGEPANFFDSQEIPIGRNNSLLGTVTITVCRDEAAASCETVVYRGIAAISV